MKLKNTFRESGKLFRDVMVVVIGIAITFSLNNWMNNKNERKDMQQYLNALKIELQENLDQVENRAIYHKEAMQLCKYLHSQKPETCQLDSLERYDWIISGTYPFFYKTSAFEMLKMSGYMRLIKDKELLSDIWNSYQGLELLKLSNESYMQKKGEVMHKYWISIDGMYLRNQSDLDNILRVPEAKQYFSFLRINVSENNYENFLKYAEYIRSTIEAIENQNPF